MARANRGLTDAQRDERRARDRARHKQACEQLLSSEGWQRWVRARAQRPRALLRACLERRFVVVGLRARRLVDDMSSTASAAP
jgi:hypothetical protein